MNEIEKRVTVPLWSFYFVHNGTNYKHINAIIFRLPSPLGVYLLFIKNKVTDYVTPTEAWLPSPNWVFLLFT